jgi:hypothetical protein
VCRRSGRSELTTFPSPSPATQYDASTQDTLKKYRPGSTAVSCQPPAVGSVELKTSPFWPKAMHNDAVGQDMASRPSVPAMSAEDHAPLPPLGSVEVNTLPRLSTAAQNVVDGQDTSRRAPELSTLLVDQNWSIPVTMSPASSVATQSPVLGQEMPESRCPSPAALASVQACGSVGSEEKSARPTESMATHVVVDAHDTPVS